MNYDFVKKWSDELASDTYNYCKERLYCNLVSAESTATYEAYDAWGVACLLLEQSNPELFYYDWRRDTMPPTTVTEYLSEVDWGYVIELSDGYGFDAVCLYLDKVVEDGSYRTNN